MMAEPEAQVRVPGRKAKPIICKEQGVCGIDPERDSASCPDASIYRRQLGCLGTACVGLSTSYFREYRRKERGKPDEEV